MVDPVTLIVLSVTGLAVGLLYYGGLWWTVRRLSGVERPGVAVALSFAVRLVLAAALLAWMMDGRPVRLLVMLTGFFAARLVLTRWLGPFRPDRPGGETA